MHFPLINVHQLLTLWHHFVCLHYTNTNRCSSSAGCAGAVDGSAGSLHTADYSAPTQDLGFLTICLLCRHLHSTCDQQEVKVQLPNKLKKKKKNFTNLTVYILNILEFWMHFQGIQSNINNVVTVSVCLAWVLSFSSLTCILIQCVLTVWLQHVCVSSIFPTVPAGTRRLRFTSKVIY